MDLTQSLLRMIVLPLERLNNKVDIIVTVNRCEHPELLEVFRTVFGSSRTVVVKPISAGGQGEAYLKALEALTSHAGSARNVRARYKLVLITRHDLRWKKPIDEWPAFFSSKINFPFHCEHGRQHSGSVLTFNHLCKNDVMQVIPSHLFLAFSTHVGSNTCFNDKTAIVPWSR